MPFCLNENGEENFSDVEKVFVYSKQLAKLANLECLEAAPVSAELANHCLKLKTPSSTSTHLTINICKYILCVFLFEPNADWRYMFCSPC